MGAAGAILGITPKITETPPKKAEKKALEEQGYESEDKLMIRLRDPKLANSLRKLSELGYKKIAFVYGIGHLKHVKYYLNNPDSAEWELSTHKDVIERNNPDAFRIYRSSPGENNSEKFVASEKMVWKRVLKKTQ